MEVVVIMHNIRSILNVGSIFRTSEGFGVKKIYLSGYSPSPQHGLPHVQEKNKRQLHKTALGAEKMVDNEYIEDIQKLISNLKSDGFLIIGLEQDKRSIPINQLRNKTELPKKIALVVGEEVNGIEAKLRDLCDTIIEIPMQGQKESFNVSVATGIALYEINRGQE